MNQKLSKTGLEQIIYNCIGTVDSGEIPDKFRWSLRCHEMARLFTARLKQLGYDAKVYDGRVSYSYGFFTEYGKTPALGPRRIDTSEGWEGILNKFRDEFTQSSVHSWIEVDGFVVDFWHEQLFQSGADYGHYGNFLVIEEKDELEGKVKYFPDGIEHSIGISLFGHYFGIRYISIPPDYLTTIYLSPKNYREILKACS